MLIEDAKQFREPSVICAHNELGEVQPGADKRPWIQVEVLDASLFSQIVVC